MTNPNPEQGDGGVREPQTVAGWTCNPSHHDPTWVNGRGDEVEERVDHDGDIEVSHQHQDQDWTYVYVPAELLAHILRANGYTVEAP